MKTHTSYNIDSIRASISRTMYRSTWQRLRDSSEYGHGPTACHIHNGHPIISGGSTAGIPPRTTIETAHRCHTDKNTSKKSKSNFDGVSSNTDGQGDEDSGDGDGDPDRHHSKSSTLQKSNIQSTSVSIFPDIALWRLSQVLDHIPVSKSTWWAGVKSGRYPPGIKISNKCTAWRVKDILKLAQGLQSDCPWIDTSATQFNATEEACK